MVDITLTPEQIAKVIAAAPTTGAGGGTTAPAPPPSPGNTVYPPDFAGRTLEQATMPWKSGTRLSGPRLAATNAWIINFRTGDASSRVVRFALTEREGGPVARIAIMFQRSSGAVRSTLAVVEPTFLCLVGQTPLPFRVILDPNTDYAVGVINAPGVEPSGMYADLYL